MRAQIDLLLEFCASVVSGTRMLTSVLTLVPNGSERYGCPLRTPPWVPSSLRSVLLFVSPTTSSPGPSPLEPALRPWSVPQWGWPCVLSPLCFRNALTYVVGFSYLEPLLRSWNTFHSVILHNPFSCARGVGLLES